ncbi:MAG: MATE family efflux transporter [Proteobacteria bacterium]|nr:MATE family efflux transporter [Pseudomonadota bacterium]
MVVSQGAYAVMVFTDRWFMSQLDAVHIAATLGGGVASFFCISLFVGIITYANALVAQYFGAQELDKCPRVVSQGAIMVLMSVPILALASYFVGDLFGAMGHDPRQVELERVYFYILMGGSVFTLMKMCIASYFSGIGRTKVVMICDVCGMLLNVPLSYALIFGKFGLPTLGIAGAALGTVVASLFALALFFSFYLAKEHREKFNVLASFRYDGKILKRYLRLGVPSGFELFMNVATFNLFLLMFQSYGVPQGAAMAIVFNWDMLSFVPMIGLHIGVMSLIGRFVGANDMARVNQVIAAGFVVAIVYSGTLGLLFINYRVPLVEIFATPTGDFSEISDLASFMMIGLSSYVVADAILLIAGGALRGAGDTRWLMITSISLHWIMLVAQYFIIMVWELGPRAAWWAFVAMIISLALVYLYRLLGDVWRHPERLARVMAD